MSRIVLAYSGGLDTSVLLKKLILEGSEVIAMTVDLGESDGVAGSGARAALEAVRAKALSLGAYDAVLVDARERFISEYAFAALRANALYQERLSAFGGAFAPADRRTARGDCPRVRRDDGGARLHRQRQRPSAHRARCARARSRLVCRAPLRESPLSRPDAIAFAREHGIPVAHTVEKPYSIDANLWGRSIEAGVLEDPCERTAGGRVRVDASPEAAPPQSAGDRRLVRRRRAEPQRRARGGDGRRAQSRLPARTASAASI